MNGMISANISYPYAKKILKTYLSSLVRGLRLLLSNSLNYLISIIILPFLTKKSGTSDRVLFVNTMNLGDLIISLKFLIQFQESDLFREHYLLFDSRYTVFFRSLNIAHKLIPWSKKKYKYNLFYRVKFINKLRKYSFATAYNISQERGILNDEITLLSNAANKVCFKKHAKYLFPFYNLINIRKYSTILDFEELSEYKLLDLVSDKLELKFINSIGDRFITNFSNAIPSSDICIAPFSSNRRRDWPFHNYLTLIQELSNKYNILLVGDKADIPADLFCNNSNVFNFIGKTILSELPGIIRNTRLFIGNDSGLTHLANVLEIPLIAIIGGGMYGRFFPHLSNTKKIFHFHKLDCFNCEWNCLYKEKYCLTKVPVAAILKDVYEILR